MKKKKLVSCLGMRKQYFVGIICGRGYMQMTVMNEGLLLNSKYIKTDREEAGFSSFPQTATPCNCS